jgi:biopolymer transport protein ExbB
MMRLPVTLLLLLAAASMAASPAEKAQKAKEAEVAQLRSVLESARDSLQYEITSRYTLKQRGVDQREADKEEFDRLREQQERAMNDLARTKEECLAKEQVLEDEKRGEAQKKDEWDIVVSSLGDLMQKEGDRIIEAFPLDKENRRSDFEAVRSSYPRQTRPTQAVRQFVEYKVRYFLLGDSLQIVKQTVLPDDGSAQMLTIARFGNVFGYGINDKSVLYIIRQTGSLGGDRYAISRIEADAVSSTILGAFPEWLRNGKPTGMVTMEIMQNDQSKSLIAGKKIGWVQSFLKWFKDGGPVMFPLMLVALWGLAIWVGKVIDFNRKHKSGEEIFHRVSELIEQKKLGEARTLAATRKGIAAHVVSACLKNAEAGRESAEKAVKEIIVEEVPNLSRHINTMAVLATAAPLLGLLGTVTGMINLFSVLTQYGNSDPKLVAGGISEALVTTQTGMIIAIPIVLIHNYLRNRRDHIESEIEKYAIVILNRLWP